MRRSLSDDLTLPLYAETAMRTLNSDWYVNLPQITLYNVPEHPRCPWGLGK